MPAGMMRERVSLDRRIETNPDAPNDFGNVVADWQEQGEVWAEFIHLRGGEAVIAGRLSGRHPVVVRVRSSALTRSVTTDWRIRDARRGTEYAVRDITTGLAMIDILCESGSVA